MRARPKRVGVVESSIVTVLPVRNGTAILAGEELRTVGGLPGKTDRFGPDRLTARREKLLEGVRGGRERRRDEAPAFEGRADGRHQIGREAGLRDVSERAGLPCGLHHLGVVARETDDRTLGSAPACRPWLRGRSGPACRDRSRARRDGIPASAATSCAPSATAATTENSAASVLTTRSGERRAIVGDEHARAFLGSHRGHRSASAYELSTVKVPVRYMGKLTGGVLHGCQIAGHHFDPACEGGAG